MTDLEYFVSLAVRTLLSIIRPSIMEEVEILHDTHTYRLKLFSGMILNFMIPSLPLYSGITVHEQKLRGYFLPARRLFDPLTTFFRRYHIRKNSPSVIIESEKDCVIKLISQECAEFFLDEDPMVFYDSLTIKIAGVVPFLSTKAFT